MIDKRLLPLALALVLCACGDSKSAPTGQVAATVNGEEITTTDIEAELAGASAATPEQQKQLQRMALDRIVVRTILAQEAREQGVDKGPEAAVLERKAKQIALVESLQRKLRGSVPQPGADEVSAFISSNPGMFAQRRVYVVDQIIVPRADVALVRALEPVKSLPEAKSVLAARRAQSSETVGVIDSLQMPPQAAQQIAALPPSEVFIIPSNGGLRINQIRSSQLNPVTGEAANAVAREMLQRQRLQSSMEQSLSKVVDAGRKSVKYNDAFAPPPAPAAGAKAPPAAATPTRQPAS